MKFKVSFKKEVEGKIKAVWVLISSDTYGHAEEQFFNYCEEHEIPMSLGEYKIVPTKITDIIVNKECSNWYLITYVDTCDDKEVSFQALIESDNDINARKEIEEIVNVKSTVSTKYIDVICQ